MKKLLAALLILGLLASAPTPATAAPKHHGSVQIWVTGYTAACTYCTADGSTPTWGTGAVSAYGGGLPMHSLIYVRGLGRFWTNDTGNFTGHGTSNGGYTKYWLDVYCWSADQAYSITGTYTASW